MRSFFINFCQIKIRFNHTSLNQPLICCHVYTETLTHGCAAGSQSSAQSTVDFTTAYVCYQISNNRFYHRSPSRNLDENEDNSRFFLLRLPSTDFHIRIAAISAGSMHTRQRDRRLLRRAFPPHIFQSIPARNRRHKNLRAPRRRRRPHGHGHHRRGYLRGRRLHSSPEELPRSQLH